MKEELSKYTVMVILTQKSINQVKWIHTFCSLVSSFNTYNFAIF